jgi:GT2 family glycosyltransferase
VAVAVLIVNYRSYDALARCLASLQPWLGPDDEVAVVDWVSSADALRPLQLRFDRVHWLPRHDNCGFAAGVNLAAASTTAPVLLLLNPDSIVEGAVVRGLEQWLTAHPICAVAGPCVLDADGHVQASARRFPGVTTALGGRTSWLTRRFPGNWFARRNLVTEVAGGYQVVDWLAGSCLATPRAVFTALGGLDEGFFLYWEDADYGRRASARGFESHYVPAVGAVRHAGGESSAHAPVRSIRAFHRSAARLFWKHAGVGRVWFPLVWVGLWLRGELKVAAVRLRT